LDFLQARKADLAALAKKFAKEAVSDEILTELVKRGEVVKETIADLTGGEDRVIAMEKELGALEKTLLGAASKLSQERKDVALRLSNLVTAEIHSLSMPHTTFECEVVSPDYSKELNLGSFAAHGADEVSMLLQAHSGGPFVSVAKGASGGELSRIMLALEVVLAQSQPVGTYIFDEVDAGVGGKAAIEVGRRLFNLSKHAQVIAITHLPQVAAWADAHFVVKKSNDGSVTQSDVVEVRSVDRVEEIARMLAGHEDSRSAQEHATELLAMRG
jgi:DNA repair protein RecN (Recombination protein N)